MDNSSQRLPRKNPVHSAQSDWRSIVPKSGQPSTPDQVSLSYAEMAREAMENSTQDNSQKNQSGRRV